MDMTIIRLGGGLLLLILANIALGSVDAIISGSFDWERFRKGAIRGGFVLAALVSVYFAGYLNPDLLVVDAGGGATLNLMDAVHALFLAAYTMYALDVLKKLRKALTTSVPSDELEEGHIDTTAQDAEALEKMDGRADE